MRNKTRTTDRAGCGIFVLLFYVYTILAYIMNVVWLVKCDFEEPFKGEAIYALGLFTPTCWVTCWLPNIDGAPKKGEE